MKKFLLTALILTSLPASALTLTGGIDKSVDVEQPAAEFEIEVSSTKTIESEGTPVDFSGQEQNLNLKDAQKKVDNDILDRNMQTNGFYYNNGQVEYIGVKVNKKDL